MALEEILDAHVKRKEKALGMGGPDKLARRAASGVLNARERLDHLLDEGRWFESGLFATSNRPEVQEYFRRHFHSLAIDIEGSIEIVDFEGTDMTQMEFASKSRVRATPLLAFYNLDGEQIFKYTGAPSGAAEFMLMGQFIADEIYLRTDERGNRYRFTRYKREQRNKQ